MSDSVEETGSGTDRSARPLTWRHQAGVFVKELVVVVIGAVVVASLLRAFVGQMFLIPSGSMENTLHRSDRIVVSKLSSIKRGEVVVFADPGGWLTDSQTTGRGPVGRALEFVGVLPDTQTKYLTKRVVGLPGDEVACCDDEHQITVNGQPLDESGYLYAPPDGGPIVPSEVEFAVTVPAGRVFVLGDHRDDSRDSRCHLNDPAVGPSNGEVSGSAGVKGDNAFVPEDLVVGRAVAVAWPAAEIKRLRLPSTYADVPSGRDPAPAQPEIDAGPDADC